MGDFSNSVKGESGSRPIVLASSSPRRVALLRRMGLEFRVVPPTGVPELLTGAEPEPLALDNALRKAAAVAGQHRDALVIGADTIVVLDGVIFGKPADRDEAAGMLAKLVGRAHDVFTAVAVIHRDRDVAIEFCERTRVWMHPLTPNQIQAYLDRTDVLDKAGAYAIQENGECIVDRIDGSYSNVMGLPTERLAATLEEFGITCALG